MDKKPRREGKGEDGLSAYYYSFDATGCEYVDRILKAVAGAGASAHNTDDWGEGYGDVLSPTESIQFVANEVAQELLKLEPPKDKND